MRCTESKQSDFSEARGSHCLMGTEFLFGKRKILEIDGGEGCGPM